MKEKKNFSKHLIIILAAISILFMNFFTVWPTAYAAKVPKKPIIKQTQPKVTPPAVKEETPVVTPVAVDEEGFDSKGRMIANFGSPVVDGEVDKIWDNAHAVTPKYVAANVETTATFKTLWDDKALYILTEVKDKDMSVQAGNPYMQDSLEIFLDEYNDKTQDYGIDDLHFRVNYENLQTVDVGDVERFYTSTQKVEGGYVIESRIALKSKPENDQAFGIDLQINDAKATERIGTINIFDATGNAWIDTRLFGEVLLTGKTPGTKIALNPYDLMTMMKIAEKLDKTLYKNPEVLTDALKTAESVLQNKKAKQPEIDKQYNDLKTAMSKLVFTDEAANEKYFAVLPDEYRAENEKQGTLESLEYSAVNATNGTDTKKLNIYLPYGYNADDTSKKYNILYMMHGYGENEATAFGVPGQPKELKKILDNMIAKGDIEPLIVVAPTFYGGKGDITLFHEELLGNVIPLVETKYNTYAESTDLSGIKDSRTHRAFGGFSMGSMTTWNIYINCMDYIKYYMPLCGAYQGFGQNSDDQYKAGAEYLAKIPKDKGYTTKDFYVFTGTGTQDFAYPNLKSQVDAMRELKDDFIYSSDTQKGNFYFVVSDGGTHAWNWVDQYIYNILPDLFID